jgi:hypothetical protein
MENTFHELPELSRYQRSHEVMRLQLALTRAEACLEKAVNRLDSAQADAFRQEMRALADRIDALEA